MNNSVRVLANIGIIIALSYFTYYSYLGITHPIPTPGDSWDYHIPISQSILNGSFLTLPHVTVPQRFYPGSSEIFNSLLILLHIPLTLSNILAMSVLLVCLYKLSRTFKLNQYFSLLYALTFITLNAIVRWQNAISIDVWVAVFFCVGIILLETPQKSVQYFIKLGFVLGMLIGSKYTTSYFLILFLLFYTKKIIKYINTERIIAFFIPFLALGLFWYIRNYFLKGNPFYPVSFLGYKGVLNFKDIVWNQILTHPLALLNAAFSEYHLWIFSFILALIVLFKAFIIKKNFKLNPMIKLFLFGTINAFVFLTFPTDSQPWIQVSSFRYSYSTFIPLILGTFMLASKYKKEEWLGYFSIANMLSVLSMIYYPKLIFIYLPLSFIVIYIVNKKFNITK